MPLMVLRSSALGLPVLGWGGNSGCINSHSSFDNSSNFNFHPLSNSNGPQTTNTFEMSPILKVEWNVIILRCYMAIMSHKTWERHANPWSGFTRIITYPLVFLPIWYFQEFLENPANNWYTVLGIILVGSWCWLNPRIFPKPKDFDHLMSKGVLGEKFWTSDKRFKNSNFLLVLLMILFFIIGLYTAYMKMFWETMFFASIPFLLKLWFVDRMVVYYEANKEKWDIY